ncbi:(Fe-S)-binding protein [Thiohalomonas denitrificans]|uniref:Ion-translocating oxidoreductase complex subunit B n=1 Tax=Thiohalomonas denitrificans TaxID=415747 RepID=A0A1G5PJ44_9GAMM|nr:RnfABCDGE type electron transport complex subunit B [Thiohalomonas denitrificans]SCZ49120.1 electron transport complex, RnfABCDGE type, B subunit [Thiohalomonas denitrificans]
MASVMHIAIAGTFMAGLGVALASVLAIANRRLHVEEDPRLDDIEEMLPSANCGACGNPGCRPFAEALLAGTTEPAKCTVNPVEVNQAIADFLGIDLGTPDKRVARLACAGGSHVAYTRARYRGLKSCRAASVVSGGGKGCSWGCLGLADCEAVCDFDAIQMDQHGLPVVDADKCTACGDCVDICPKDLFSVQPTSHRLWVACKNRDMADEGEAHCEVVCNACGRCSADSPEGLIAMEDNLAVIDYEKNDLASKVAIERCPTGAIVWLDVVKGAIKGAKAKRVTRKQPLPERVEPLPRP